MRHLSAYQLPDGGWHYASVSRRGGYPLGYCRDHAGHPTEADARECYGQWQRDHVRLDGHCSWTSCTVKGCDSPANRFAEVEGSGYTSATLCDAHLTTEHAVAAMGIEGPAGDSWET